MFIYTCSQKCVFRYNANVSGRRFRSFLLEEGKKSSNATVAYNSSSGSLCWGRVACGYQLGSRQFLLLQKYDSKSAIETLRKSVRDETQSDHLANILRECDRLSTVRRLSMKCDAPYVSVPCEEISSHGILVVLETRVYVVKAPFFHMRV